MKEEDSGAKSLRTCYSLRARSHIFEVPEARYNKNALTEGGLSARFRPISDGRLHEPNLSLASSCMST
jgi:hypothetical protein